jgi:hypothetical protein
MPWKRLQSSLSTRTEGAGTAVATTPRRGPCGATAGETPSARRNRTAPSIAHNPVTLIRHFLEPSGLSSKIDKNFFASGSQTQLGIETFPFLALKAGEQFGTPVLKSRDKVLRFHGALGYDLLTFQHRLSGHPGLDKEFERDPRSASVQPNSALHRF